MSRACIYQHLGPWAIDPLYAQSVLKLLQEGKIHMMENQSGSIDRPLEIVANHEGIAILDVAGPLMKVETKFDEGTSTLRLRRSLRELVSDKSVDGVMLRIESPGGRSAGQVELIEAVRSFSGQKPIRTFIEDWAASAALWLAAGTDFVSINEAGRTGSIGTYAILVDSSEALKMKGFKFIIISTGGLKGQGVDGAEITEELTQEVQRLVDSTNEFFIRDIALGRNMSTDDVRKMADGRMFLSDEAVDNGLVDIVETFEESLQRFLDDIESNKKKKEMRSQIQQLG